MGPLEKMKAFGVKPSDLPLDIWHAIQDSLSKNFPDHAKAYATAADQMFAENGRQHSSDYNRTKGHFGAMDYMLRYKDRSPEDAANLARVYQYKQAMFRDPKQDLLDLEANLAGIQEGNSLRGKEVPADSSQSPSWEELMNRSRDYANKLRNTKNGR